jgi:hypothetical protein
MRLISTGLRDLVLYSILLSGNVIQAATLQERALNTIEWSSIKLQHHFNSALLLTSHLLPALSAKNRNGDAVLPAGLDLLAIDVEGLNQYLNNGSINSVELIKAYLKRSVHTPTRMIPLPTFTDDIIVIIGLNTIIIKD